MASASTRQATSRIAAGGARHALEVHLPALDGLRGFAACAVVVGHVRAYAGVGLAADQISSYAVLLFFILSGFLMGHLYLDRRFSPDEAAAYFAARFSRIAPLYYAVGLLAFLYGRIDRAFFYYMSPLDGLRHIVMMDRVGAFWTIAPEVQFYFLFPLIWWLAQLPLRRRIPFGVVAAAAALAVIAFRYQLPGLLVLSKLHIFLLGVAIAVARPCVSTWTGRAAAALAQIMAVAILLCLVVPPPPAAAWLSLDGAEDRIARFYCELPRVFMIGFCVFAFTLPATPVVCRLFANRVARGLGRYSFSIYLLHTPIVYAAVALGWTKVLPEYAAVALILALTWLVGAASYRWFEEPSRLASRAALLRLFATGAARLVRLRRTPLPPGSPAAR